MNHRLNPRLLFGKTSEIHVNPSSVGAGEINRYMVDFTVVLPY